jgi:hypothetical protein
VNLAAGRFLVPSRYRDNPYAAKFVRLFERVAERLDARVMFCDDASAADLPADCPFVMAVNPVLWCYAQGFRGLLSLPPRIRVFGLWDDIHQGKQGSRRFHPDRRVLVRFFRRCDAVLCTYRSPFLRWYPRYRDKFVHLPFFYSAADFDGVPYNPAPLAKCILSGAISAFYPFRAAAARNPDVVVMSHPGYGEGIVMDAATTFGAAYARELARYRCAVTCSSVLDYVVAKYMELPAAGCLLLATEAPDLGTLGFRNGVNYLRVDERSFDGTLADVLGRPEAFEGVRRAGHELVRARHSDIHRADQLEQLIRERCAVSAGA